MKTEQRLLTSPQPQSSAMVYPLQDRYISLLTDFGFKRIFGTEPNKNLLLDFLNTLLPIHHQIAELTFRNTEQLGSTPIDRKAIFDIYCQAVSGERFIVEIQKAKQNFFKDRSVYYATFPIQEQALKGEWNYELSTVYTVGVLDFIFDDHKNDSTLLHIIELKDQDCRVFYDKLKFIYIELPKFTKPLDQLTTHFDKWLYLLKHLADLTDRPLPLQEEIFNELFDAAEIANFEPNEQNIYQNSLKYYRDMNNVVDTARQEGVKEGIERGIEEGIERGVELERSRTLDRQRSLILRFLKRSIGDLPATIETQISELAIDRLEQLQEVMVEFTELEALITWLSESHP
jgi:predicted transposase/invertase (TIGR01784 family)